MAELLDHAPVGFINIPDQESRGAADHPENLSRTMPSRAMRFQKAET